jgi:TolB-like protein
MTGWIIATCAALAIIPTTNRDRTLTARPLRGDEPSINNVRFTADDLAAAQKNVTSCQRIAVLPFVAPAGDDDLKALARGVTSAFTADLHYLPGLLVLDPSEYATVATGTVNPARSEALAAAAKAIGTRYLITGSVARGGSDLVLEAILFDAEAPEAIARSHQTGPEAKLFALADAALLAVLPKPLAPEARRTREMTKIPTASPKARALCDQAAALIERTTGVSKGDDAQLAAKAKDLLAAALKADPKYLQAYLLQASCLARLGETGPLQRTLLRAHNTRVPADRFDELTGLELEGDYYVFVKGVPAAAAEQYAKMLAIDPYHLHALWMMAAIHAGDFDLPKWSGYDLKKAAPYAARLVAAHPNSPAAKFLARTRP